MSQPAGDLAYARLPLTVALCTGEIGIALVAQLTGYSLDEAQRAIAGWLRAGELLGDGPRAKHPRVRRTARLHALEVATPRQQRRAYDDLAQALDDPQASEAVTLDVARYYRDAGRTRLSLARFLHVADERAERGDFRAAAAVLDEAATTIASAGPELLPVLESRARAAVVLGDASAALAALERMRRIAGACGDRFATIRALLATGEVELDAGNAGAATDAAKLALALVGRPEHRSREAASAMLLLAEAACETGRPAHAARHLRDAQVQGVAADPELDGRCHRVAGKLHLPGDPAAACADFEAALAAARAAQDVLGGLAAARCLAGARRARADLHAAASGLRDAVHGAGAFAASIAARRAVGELVALYVDAGRPADARRLCTPAVAAAAPSAVLRVALHVEDTELIAACEPLDALNAAFASGSPQRIGALVPPCAALARSRDDGAGADALYRRALERLAGTDAPLEFWCDAAQHAATSDIAAVAAALDGARGRGAGLDALLLRFGDIALDCRSPAGSAAIAGRADALAADFLAAGFRAWATRTRGLAAGEPPPHAPRNETILTMIAAGRANAAIASTLGVSKRSVDAAMRTLVRAHATRVRRQFADRTPRAKSG